MLGSEGRIPQRGSGDKRIELASKDWPEGGRNQPVSLS